MKYWATLRGKMASLRLPAIEFKQVLDCCGASHLSVQCRLLSDIGLEKLLFRGKWVRVRQEDHGWF